MPNPQPVVRSLLIPIHGGEVVLPSTVIAEITHYVRPEKINNKQPNWLLGLISWRNQQVPLISLEETMSLPSSEKESQRMIVLYGLESPQNMPFYAFTAVDIPRVLVVTEGSLLNPKPEKRPGFLFTVGVEQAKTIWLIDLPYIENLLRNYLSNYTT